MLDNTGLFVTDALINIVDPVPNQTWAFLTTDGQIHVFNGVGYDVITGGGAGSGITTLTGDVSAGPGSGSQAATIAAAAVTLAKIANAAANSKLVGSGASGSGASYSEITLGTNLSMSGTTLNASGGGGGGGLTLVEHKTITGNTTTVTFSGLDGNTDGVYRLIAKILNNSGGTPFYKIAPNGATTNIIGQQLYGSGASPSASGQAFLTIGFANANAKWFRASIDIDARKNPNSIASPMTYSGTFFNFDGTNPFAGTVGGEWTETSTNITTLDVVSSIASGIGDGSELWLYKYEQ